MSNLSFEEAKRLSIIKWEWLSTPKETRQPKMPGEIVSLLANCGFCERYEQYCRACEINMGLTDGCFNTRHLFYLFFIADKDSKTKAAKKVLELIKNAKPNEEAEG